MTEEKITNQDILDAMKNGFDTQDKRFDTIEKHLTKAESLMVTKDYLDDKLGDLKGDLIVMMRKEDTKLKALVEILSENKVITKEQKDKIFGLEPFPEMKIV